MKQPSILSVCPYTHSSATLCVSKCDGCISLTYGNLNVSLGFDCFSATVSMPVTDVSSGCNSSKRQMRVQLIFGIFHMLKWKILVQGNFF